MMFECIDKVYPSVSIDTVTGAICSFFDNIGGMPLKSCVSQISGYQEGSGTPSPSNVRPLVSFNSATLTENGNTHLFTFGQSIYQGYIDWKRGVVVGTHGIADLGSLNWTYTAGDPTPHFTSTASPSGIKAPATYGTKAVILCTKYNSEKSWSAAFGVAGNDKYVAISAVSGLVGISDFAYTDPTAFKTAMNGVMLAYELATPIEIPLGGVNLLTQEGQNNIYCDTGNTTVEYIKIV